MEREKEEEPQGLGLVHASVTDRWPKKQKTHQKINFCYKVFLVQASILTIVNTDVRSSFFFLLSALIAFDPLKQFALPDLPWRHLPSPLFAPNAGALLSGLL